MAARSNIGDQAPANAEPAAAKLKGRNAQTSGVAAIASEANAVWRRKRRAACQIDLERRARFSRIEPL